VVADTSAPRYRIRKEGEPRTRENSLQLAIHASADCHLTIVDVDSEGGVNVLFPNAAQGEGFYPEGKVPGGETVLIPDSIEGGNRARFFLDYGPPSGLDTIRVFASVSPDTTGMIREIAGRSRGDVGTRSISKSFRELQLALARPRGVVVIGDEASETGAAGPDAIEASGSGGPEAAALAADEPGLEEAGAAEGDWTARSITILVED
jgi:hypothetical protein